jgi:hypothetical protein
LLTDYIQAAIDSIEWKILPDGTFYAEISLLGLKTGSEHLEDCQRRIREMLEEHIVLSLHKHQALPVIGVCSLKVDANYGLPPASNK